MASPDQPETLQGRSTAVGRLLAFAQSILDPRTWFQALKLLHYYNYTHVLPRRALVTGAGVRLAPNVSLQNAERIRIGDRSRIGARCSLWAGKRTGTIAIGAGCTLAPDVFVTAANYRFDPGVPILEQEMDEQHVEIGDDVWLGTRVIVLAGVTIGSGCVVGAGSVVTKSLPPNSIAVGSPARVVADRAAAA